MAAGYEKSLRALGEGPMIDLVRELEGAGEVPRLGAMEVGEAFGYLRPRIRELMKILPVA
jgi:hypothetical protein